MPRYELPPWTPSPVIDAYKPGVDRTLLIKNLQLTHDERFEQFVAMQKMFSEFSQAGKQAFSKDDESQAGLAQ